MNNNFIAIFKLMLVLTGISFNVALLGQNILANPNFQKQFRCCEVNEYHLTGWYTFYGFMHRDKIKEKRYLRAYCFNPTTGYSSFLIGSFIKPISKGKTYKIKIALYYKRSFKLHYASSVHLNIQSDKDTLELSKMKYLTALINNQTTIEVDYTPENDSCNYLILKFEDLQQVAVENTKLQIRSIELIDTTEDQQNLPIKYQQRLKEIYAETRRHDFTVPCTGNQTLRR